MSERLYALLLQCYPAAFRQRYADEMLRVFRERLRDESAARVWLDVLIDAFVSIPQQHWAPRPDPILPPSAAPVRLRANCMISFWLACFFLPIVIGLSIVTLSPWQSALAVAAVLAAFAVPTRAMRRLERRIRQSRADVQGDTITLHYAGLAPLTLQRREVIAVQDCERLGMRIKSADPERDLWVPATSDSYAAIKVAVSNWAPLEAIPFKGSFPIPVPFHLAVLCGISLVAPMAAPLAAGAVLGLTIQPALTGVAKGDLSVRRRLASVAPLAIVLIRWIW